jgi:hypothetical protein
MTALNTALYIDPLNEFSKSDILDLSFLLQPPSSPTLQLKTLLKINSISIEQLILLDYEVPDTLILHIYWVKSELIVIYRI